MSEENIPTSDDVDEIDADIQRQVDQSKALAPRALELAMAEFEALEPYSGADVNAVTKATLRAVAAIDKLLVDTGCKGYDLNKTHIVATAFWARLFDWDEDEQPDPHCRGGESILGFARAYAALEVIASARYIASNAVDDDDIGNPFSDEHVGTAEEILKG